MQKKEKFYFAIDKKTIAKFKSSPKLLFWYIILQDYAARFKKDRLGFVRVPSQVFDDDFGIDRVKLWRYNKKLEDKGFIKVDRKHRGGRTWVGFKFI